MRTLQLYAAITATANAAAQITVPSATKLKGVYLSIASDVVADNVVIQLEFSKIPTRQIAVNGAQDPFLSVNFNSNLVTSGLTLSGGVEFIPLDVECRQGEIIYIHALQTGTATTNVTAIFVY